MPDLAYYLALVPSANAPKPKFTAVLTALLQPLADVQVACKSITDSFNLDTAVGVQLDQVGQWIGTSRNILVPIDNVYFSWDTSGLGWNEGVWQGPNDPSEGLRALDDTTYRTLLYAKILVNNWDGAMEDFAAPYTLMVGNLAYLSATDNQDMTVNIDVRGTIGVILTSLLTEGYVKMKPEAVRLNINVSSSLLFAWDTETNTRGGWNEAVWS